MESKSVWLSKMFLVNIIALAAMITQGITGTEFISLEVQGSILAVVNIILRLVTRQPVTWS